MRELLSCARYRVDCAALSAPLSLDITGILLITGENAAVSAPSLARNRSSDGSGTRDVSQGEVNVE